MERGRTESGTEGGPDGDRAARERADRDLVLAMRAGEHAAFAEYIRRFLPVLAEDARRVGMRGAEADDRALAFLDDAALRLIAGDAPLPRALAAWLITGFRRRLLNLRRDRARAARRVGEAVAESEGAWGAAREEGASIVAPLASEHALRASRGPEWEPPAPSPALARLAAALEARLGDDERMLLVWAGSWVPQRTIAEWLGVRYETVQKRIERLRARLRALADDYAAALPPDERRTLERFLRRVGAVAPPRRVETTRR